MKLKGLDIIVVGGGIGGLAAALALARRGAEVRVLERSPALEEVGAGLQISPNGVAVLAALGLAEAAARVANVPEAVELRNGRSGALVARLPLGATIERRHGHPYWQFHRADLLDVLAAAVRSRGVYVRLGAEVANISETAEAVHVGLDDGSNLTADCVVAADGVRSFVRSALFHGPEARFTGQVAWRGLVDAGMLPAGTVANAATVFMGPRRHLVAYPLRGGSVINVAAFEERAAWTAEGWTHAENPENLRRAFSGWGRAVSALLEAVDQTFLWGLFDHPVLPRWALKRVALLGDACHPMLPYLAQGATMALEDAWVLACSLAQARDVADGLVSYARKRKPRATRVQQAARTNARVYHARAPLALPLHLGLGAVSRLAPGLLLGKFDWLYGRDVTAQ
ncbi:MAG: FAD-dependent oxidoreductase [Paracoccaceae bacterium]